MKQTKFSKKRNLPQEKCDRLVVKQHSPKLNKDINSRLQEFKIQSIYFLESKTSIKL